MLRIKVLSIEIAAKTKMKKCGAMGWLHSGSAHHCQKEQRGVPSSLHVRPPRRMMKEKKKARKKKHFKTVKLKVHSREERAVTYFFSVFFGRKNIVVRKKNFFLVRPSGVGMRKEIIDYIRRKT